MSSKPLNARCKKDIASSLDSFMENFATHFGEQWGGGACEGDVAALKVFGELHMELARTAAAFAAKHGIALKTTPKDVQDSIDECIELTEEKEEESEEEESEEEEASLRLKAAKGEERITVGELAAFLVKVISAKGPELPISHIEFGSIAPTGTVEFHGWSDSSHQTDEMLIFDR